MTPEGTACRRMVTGSLKHYRLPHTEAAIRLICMIGAHESGGFLYSQQVNGPALSFFQIEPVTFRGLCSYARQKQLWIARQLPCDPLRLVFDPRFAAAMSRVFFLRFPEPLPAEDDLNGLASYAKRYWNTRVGKACVEDYHQAWMKYFDET